MAQSKMEKAEYKDENRIKLTGVKGKSQNKGVNQSAIARVN
jgi:hypothetical protein